MAKKYDVCLSFAGENRDYVEAVASSLTAKGIHVFYDQYEKVDLWGKDLYQHLDKVYRENALYCVIFISEAYAKKLWTRHELRSAQAKAFRENREYILPARFDDTELPGVLETIGYVDLSNTTPDDLAEMIVEKLRGSSELPVAGIGAVGASNLGSIPIDMKAFESAIIQKDETHYLIKCGRCAGTGTRDRDGRDPPCSVCNGSGVIKLLKKSGVYAKCGFCKGTGTRDHDGRDPVCPLCKGIGGYIREPDSIVCARCNGEGTRDHDGRLPLCSVCKGFGFLLKSTLREF